MINSVKLTNFQKWKEKEIIFQPGINVIIGESRKGKSSIFRSLLFALMNESKKTNFVTWGEKFSEVEVDMNGSVIIRRKSLNGSKNEYEIDGALLKAFGVGVPDEVQKVAKIEDINIQRQHDPDFLVTMTMSAGDRGKYLNQLVGLESIDESFSKASEMQSATTSKLKARKEQLAEIEEQKEKLSFLDEAIVSFEEIDSRKKATQQTLLNIRAIEDKVMAVTKIDSQTIAGYEDILRITSSLEESKLKLDAINNKRLHLEKLIDKYPVEIKIEPLVKMVSRIISMSKQQDEVDRLDLLVEKFKNIGEKNKKIISDEKEAMAELFELSPTCPLCKGDWKNVHNRR